MDADQPTRRRDRLVEIAAIVLLTVAVIATAWAGYQASQWHGEQAIAAGKATALRVESTRASSEANRQAGIDVATFTQWVDAFATGNDRLATFYRRRFRDEFRPAVDRWIALRPLINPRAPLTPFALPEYRLKAVADADRLETAAAAASEEVKEDVGRANDYVLAVVLFATSLALAGAGTRLTSPGARAFIVGLGCAVFAGTAIWMGTFPVSV